MRLGRCLSQFKAAFSLTRHPVSTISPFIRHASSDTNSPTQNQDKVSADPDYVSIQEMKGLIEQYDKGDMDAIPSIFEAILKRQLVNKKHNLQSDPEIDQLLKDRRLGMETSAEDEDILDDDIEEHETDLDSDWTSDDQNKDK